MPNVPKPLGSTPQKTSRRRVKRKDAMGALDAGVRAGLPNKKQGNKNGGSSPDVVDDGMPTMQEVRAAVRQKFGPVRQELKRERRASNQQLGNIDDWYGDYVAQVQAATQNQMAANTAMAQAQQDRTNQSFTAGQASALTGAGTQAAMARRASADSFGALLASQGASAVNVLGQQQVAGAQSKLAAQKTEQGRKREIAAKFLDLARDRGDYREAYIAQAKADAHKQRLEEAAFGLDALETRADIRDQKADNRRDRRKANQTVNQWGYTNKEWRQKSEEERTRIKKDQANYADDPKDKSADREKAREDRKERNTEIRNTVADINRYRRKTNGKGEHPTLEDIRDWLREDGVDVDIIDAAIQSLPKKKRRRYRKPGGPAEPLSQIPGTGIDLGKLVG